jgi:hypothetical protein
VGARWVDSNTGIEYVWINDGDNYYWIQPTVANTVILTTLGISSATYSLTFNYEYYGISYSSGTCGLTLPLGVTPDDNGKFINVADESGKISYNNRSIYVFGQSGQMINGYPYVIMQIDWMSLNFMFRNGNWKTI